MANRGIKGTTTTLAIVAFVVGLVVGALVYPVVFPPAEAPVGLTGEVKLGGLFAMTGALATFGENEKLAAELAIEQVNDLLETMGADWTLVLEVEDTQVNPDLALEAVESFAARGITLLIGPLASSEVRAIKGYCDANKILAISQSSTAPDLAIADDYIFRFCPTDALGQGPALARIMCDDGIRYVIPATRNDAWGAGLEGATKVRFEALGGTFLEGILYPEDATEFTIEAADLASKVQDAIATYGADQVAVLHISFEEVVPFMTACLAYDVLDDVVWYGSDGTAASSDMTANAAVAEFSTTVEYPCTIFAPTESEKFEMVRQHSLDVLGRAPESYSYTVFDIVWAYALCLMAVDKYDATAVKEVLPTITETMFGASGWITLDEAGDRMAGDYDIWQIIETAPGVYEWDITGLYVLATDSVTWD